MKGPNKPRRGFGINEIVDATLEWFEEIDYEELKEELKREWNIDLTKMKYIERLIHCRRKQQYRYQEIGFKRFTFYGK